MLWLYAPHTIDVTALQRTAIDQRATSLALGGAAFSGNEAYAPTGQTIFVVGQ